MKFFFNGFFPEEIEGTYLLLLQEIGIFFFVKTVALSLQKYSCKSLHKFMHRYDASVRFTKLGNSHEASKKAFQGESIEIESKVLRCY